jgi:hypothetical protein
LFRISDNAKLIVLVSHVDANSLLRWFQTPLCGRHVLGFVTIKFCLTRKIYRQLVHFRGVSAEHKKSTFVQLEWKHEYSLRDVTTCSLVNRCGHWGGMCCFHLQCRYCFAFRFQSPPSQVLLVDGKRGDDHRLEVGVSALLRGSK